MTGAVHSIPLPELTVDVLFQGRINATTVPASWVVHLKRRKAYGSYSLQGPSRRSHEPCRRRTGEPIVRHGRLNQHGAQAVATS